MSVYVSVVLSSVGLWLALSERRSGTCFCSCVAVVSRSRLLLLCWSTTITFLSQLLPGYLFLWRSWWIFAQNECFILCCESVDVLFTFFIGRMCSIISSCSLMYGVIRMTCPTRRMELCILLRLHCWSFVWMFWTFFSYFFVGVWYFVGTLSFLSSFLFFSVLAQTYGRIALFLSGLSFYFHWVSFMSLKTDWFIREGFFMNFKCSM